MEGLKNYLPLKSIDDIKNMETRLQNMDFLTEYITFTEIIDGHTPKENIHNALTRMFTNECAMKCSWKRDQSFQIYNLSPITIMMQPILKLHTTLTETEFDDIAAEWFRSAKQRHDRELKNSTP